MKTARTFLLTIGFFLGADGISAFVPANRPIDVQHYSIEVKLDPSSDPKEFQAQVTIRVKALAALDTFSLDRKDLTVIEAQQLRPRKATITVDSSNPQRIGIRLPQLLKQNEIGVITLRYTGKIQTANHGLFKVVDRDDPKRGPLLFTHFEPNDARSFFPCNDEPHDKATTEMVVTVPRGFEAISNGKKLLNRKLPAENGKEWQVIHWKMEKPHSTYLVSLAVGPFATIAANHGSIPVSVWVGEGKTPRARFALDSTTHAMQFFEKYLDVKYPWPKYATVGLPTFVWGGMENTSSTHMNEERTLLNDNNSELERSRIYGLAAHELAHQWFGDYVTLKWWDDLWLNESFANHLGHLAVKAYFKGEQEDIRLAVGTWDDYFRQEDGPRSHPIVDKELKNPEEAFDSISYTKGQNVLRMLSLYVGEDKFRRGLKRYLDTYSLANATYLDFFGAIEKASGEKLDAFRDSWLLNRGYPIITHSGKWDPSTSSYTLTLSQRANHPSDNTLFTFKLPVVFHRQTTPSYHKEVLVSMNGKTLTHTSQLLSAPEWVTVNPGSIVLAKIEQADRDEGILAVQAISDPDPVTRVRAAYDLTGPFLRGGKLSSKAEKTFNEMLKQDSSAYVRIALLNALQKSKVKWFPKSIGENVFDLAKTETSKSLAPAEWDARARRLWRSELLGTLGKVENDDVLPYLMKLTALSDLPLDDLEKSAYSVAAQGKDESAGALRKAVQIHGQRGYRYRYVLQIATGAYESPKAAKEIRQLAATGASDLMGRMGGVIRDNETLKNSSEWAEFLQEFILTDNSYGDEVKSRLLQTIEEVKSSSVKNLLETLQKQTTSERIREASKKILQKNFT